MSTAVPREVTASYLLWSAAIAAGVFETMLAVVDAATNGTASGWALLLGVGLRVVVFLALAYLVAQLWLGRRWSRYALAMVPGVFGTLSLTVGPAIWLVGNNSVGTALADADATALLFGATRIVHIIAVLGAVVFMFLPAANAYFRPTPRPRAAQIGSGLIRQNGETGPVPAPSG